MIRMAEILNTSIGSKDMTSSRMRSFHLKRTFAPSQKRFKITVRHTVSGID